MHLPPNSSSRPSVQSSTRRRLLSQALLTLGMLGAAVQAASAAILLTEIHYNGPAAGADPDEFIELVNTGTDAVDLSGYRFSAGIDLLLAGGTVLGAGEVLVAARSPDDFLRIFSDYTGPLLDFGGSLSNSGETLTLDDRVGNPLWSLSYDDSSPWPSEADGGGFSLQLRADPLDPLHPDAWTGAAPSPGSWEGLAPVTSAPRAVAVPTTLLLTLPVLLLLLSSPIAHSVTRFLPFRHRIRANWTQVPARVRSLEIAFTRESSCSSISSPGNPSSTVT